MQLVKQRKKRLGDKDKCNIINKEQNASATINEFRFKEMLNTNSKIGTLFKASEEKFQMHKSLSNWCHDGFKNSKNNQKRFSAAASPELLDMTTKFYTKFDKDGNIQTRNR